MAAVVLDRDLHRSARFRTARPAMGRCRPEAQRAHVRQRADRYRTIGRPKSETSERSVPLLPMVVNVLREHRLACPKGEQDLVFPNDAGNVYDHASIIKRGFVPLMVKAGVTSRGQRQIHRPARLRHFYAWWCINRKVDGGLELPLKLVQTRLGHASIQMTADTYGHMFPRGDDGASLRPRSGRFWRDDGLSPPAPPQRSVARHRPGGSCHAQRTLPSQLL